MPNPVVHFEIMVKNPKALAGFYREAFDWQIPDQPVPGGSGVPEYYLVSPDGEQPPKSGINGGFGVTPEGYGGHVTFYIAVEDIDAALDKVEKLGGTRMLGPDQVPNGPVIALFSDPQGNTVGLVKAEM
ncbi:MAG TPA: VOC family protein [Candidatus Cybelea sp.]|nr:VOC family protein [Candidatus Cybelea sp.]